MVEEKQIRKEKMITSIFAVLGTNALAQVYKNAVSKYGDTGVHLFIFGVALVISTIWSIATSVPTFMVIVQNALAIGASAIAMYEVIFKQIGSFELPDIQ